MARVTVLLRHRPSENSAINRQREEQPPQMWVYISLQKFLNCLKFECFGCCRRECRRRMEDCGRSDWASGEAGYYRVAWWWLGGGRTVRPDTERLSHCDGSSAAVRHGERAGWGWSVSARPPLSPCPHLRQGQSYACLQRDGDSWEAGRRGGGIMCVEYPSTLLLKRLRPNSCLPEIASYVALLCLWKNYLRVGN